MIKYNSISVRVFIDNSNTRKHSHYHHWHQHEISRHTTIPLPLYLFFVSKSVTSLSVTTQAKRVWHSFWGNRTIFRNSSRFHRLRNPAQADPSGTASSSQESMSSRVCGSSLPRVSGRKRKRKMMAKLILPARTPGAQTKSSDWTHQGKCCGQLNLYPCGDADYGNDKDYTHGGSGVGCADEGIITMNKIKDWIHQEQCCGQQKPVPVRRWGLWHWQELYLWK